MRGPHSCLDFTFYGWKLCHSVCVSLSVFLSRWFIIFHWWDLENFLSEAQFCSFWDGWDETKNSLAQLTSAFHLEWFGIISSSSRETACSLWSCKLCMWWVSWVMARPLESSAAHKQRSREVFFYFLSGGEDARMNENCWMLTHLPEYESRLKLLIGMWKLWARSEERTRDKKLEISFFFRQCCCHDPPAEPFCLSQVFRILLEEREKY